MDSADIKLLEEKDFTVRCSYLYKDKIKNMTPYSVRCNEIFISSNPNTYVKIGYVENKGNYIFTIPSTRNFCLWFSSPIELNSFLKRGLLHHHYLYINNGEEKEITEFIASILGIVIFMDFLR